MGDDFGAADEPLGDTAVVHNIARQHKEGDGQQGEGIGAGEGALGGGHHGLLKGQNDHDAGGGARADGQADGEAQGQHNHDGDHHDEGGDCSLFHIFTSSYMVVPASSVPAARSRPFL